jgi:hypothetical protein
VRHAVEIEREDLAEVVDASVERLMRVLRPRVGPGARVRVGHHLASLPGLVEQLGARLRVPVESLERGAAALGAAACAGDIERVGGPRTLTMRLGAVPESPVAPRASPRRPTHVVHAGLAYPIPASGLAVGSGPEGLAFDQESVAVQCMLREAAGAVVAEPRAPVSLNGRILEAPAPVVAGDRLGFAESGAELLLVAVTDGARA